MTTSTSKARGTSRASFLLRDLRAAKGSQYKIIKIKSAISMIAVTPATESTKASLASW